MVDANSALAPSSVLSNRVENIFLNPNYKIYIIKRLLLVNRLHRESKLPMGGVQKLDPDLAELEYYIDHRDIYNCSSLTNF
jgi:hypothetical protein